MKSDWEILLWIEAHEKAYKELQLMYSIMDMAHCNWTPKNGNETGFVIQISPHGQMKALPMTIFHENKKQQANAQAHSDKNKSQSIGSRQKVQMQNTELVYSMDTKWIINDAMMTLMKYFYCRYFKMLLLVQVFSISPISCIHARHINTVISKVLQWIPENISMIIANWKHQSLEIFAQSLTN